MVVPGDGGQRAMVSSLQRALGTELLCYLLNIEREGSVDNLQLSELQAQTATALLGWAGLPPGLSGGVGDYIQVDGLSRYIDSESTSVANILRRLSGGSIEKAAPSGDPLIDALADLAADIWPVYLARPRGEGPATLWMSTPIGMYDHPAAGRAVDAFLKDAKLTKLFPYPPDETPPDGRSGLLSAMGYKSLIVSNGQSGSLALTSVVSGLVSGSAFRLLMTGVPLSLSGMIPHIASAVADLRALAQGQEVRVPTWLA
jgi:hypothetical protein